MKRILAGLCLILFFYGCNNGTSGSPKATVTAFIEAAKEGNIAEIKKHITKSDAGLLDLGESFFAKLDPKSAKDMKDKMASEFKAKTKDANIEIKDEKMDGDNATVNVVFNLDGKRETRPFSLIKEDGQWKISLLSTGMNNAGSDSQDIQETMNTMNMDSLKAAISKGMEEFDKMDKDSLKKVIEEGLKDAEKQK